MPASQALNYYNYDHPPCQEPFFAENRASFMLPRLSYNTRVAFDTPPFVRSFFPLCPRRLLDPALIGFLASPRPLCCTLHS